MITQQETSCKCGCGLNVQPAFLAKLNEIRQAYGKPIVILSGARCIKHNASVGGSPKSSHIEGLAADLMRSSQLRAFLVANAERFNIYLEDPASTGNDEGGWLHVTTRPPPSRSRIFTP